jgi:hypothetical protein
MTVWELIVALQKMPMDAEVLVYHAAYDEDEPDEVDTIIETKAGVVLE